MRRKYLGMRQIILACLAIVATTGACVAQVSSEQQSAIRANCRSDFMSNCSGVTPGGKEALQCLQRNVGKLSAGCKTAVSATIPAAAPAPAASAPPPAPAAPPPATAAPAAPPPAAPSTAAKPETPPAANKPAAPKPVTTAKPPVAPAPAPVAASAAPPPAAFQIRRPLLRELVVVRRLCGGDIEVLCRSVPPGDGRIAECLAAQYPALSPGCKDALAPLKN